MVVDRGGEELLECVDELEVRKDSWSSLCRSLDLSTARVTDEALQVCGGMGLMSDFLLARFRHDVRVERTWDGNSAIQRHITGRICCVHPAPERARERRPRYMSRSQLP